MTIWLLRLDPPSRPGATVAVKDMIDVAGTPTTAACAPLRDRAGAADTDADCVAAVRAAGGRIIGKTNLHELAFGGTGINPTTGTPTNPLRPEWIPGGSSSGNAVALATEAVDIAIGTDTGGSIRTPSACCGIVGLKTTYGRIPTAGVYPLAHSLDTVGPMARTVADVELGMRMLEPSFVAADEPAHRLGRVHIGGVADWIEHAIDRVLATAEIPVAAAELPGWDDATDAGATVAFAEALAQNARLAADHADELTPEVRARFDQAATITDTALAAARARSAPWRRELQAALGRAPVLVTAGITDEPAPLSDPLRLDTRRPNVALNLAGNPALVVPIPRHGGPVTSLQLVASAGREDLLVATARVIEAAAATLA